MSKWLISIVGVVFLGILLDLVYPNGKTNAFCRSIFGIMIVCIMISPIVKYKNNDYSIDLNNSSLLTSINESKEFALKSQIEGILRNKGIDGVVVEIESNLLENDFQIENIYVDTSELVLTENLTNINKYEVISRTILEFVDIDNERLIIYG